MGATGSNDGSVHPARSTRYIRSNNGQEVISQKLCDWIVDLVLGTSVAMGMATKGHPERINDYSEW